ncbi:ABC transporter ATP-binding protein [Aerococcus sp. HMSC10H05]|uniref:ABC transporter ATP-binding protein n=1 Tax=Aerococcus sp. HMSC10H05 TaxID=1581084 RepID=UPI0008A377AE|nr:ABC transporter ATP-binding protein [Aerococcus sp. HMSC10H05]OFU49844.1 proline/glycine betaine ABC transporter ATP-binding protein [Aerococcus sp. HMSC10H05]
MTSIIEFKHVEKVYGDKRVIDDLNLTIHEGEFFVLVGPSGSGKTTSLKMVNGLTKPTGGDVYFKGQKIKDHDIEKMRWNMGYVLQKIALFPTMNVSENIDVIPEMIGWPKEKRAARIDELLDLVGLDPEIYRNRPVDALSGGEQQRIGILRAIAAEPDIILMDEPFSALDPISRNQLQDLVVDIHQRLKTTILFVTHDMNEAIKLADRIGIMNQGRLVQVDTAQEILTNPENQVVASLFNQEKEDVFGLNIFRPDIQPLLGDHPDYPKIDIASHQKDLYALLATDEVVEITENDKRLGTLDRQAVFARLKNL